MSEATRVKYERVSEQISLMQQVVSNMLHVAHNMENRSVAFSHDMKVLASSMRYYYDTIVCCNIIILDSIALYLLTIS